MKVLMQKEFNITGNCRSAKHYIADVSAKLAQTFRMVERGDYFIINRPRQYGKTTTLYTLADMLRNTGEYIVLNSSFEGIGDAIFNDEKVFSQGFVDLLAKYASVYMPQAEKWLRKTAPQIHSLKMLESMLTEFVNQTDKKVVLMIDEVDKSSNNQLFVSFLAMLRNKYLDSDTFKTFHSVVLAGVHDVKSLKLKIRPNEEQKYNSPWNIAAEFTVDMNLYPAEIKPMLDEYVADRGVLMDTQQIAETLFYYTSGYPFLVSKLCKMLDETYLLKEWTAKDVEIAVQQLVRETNTNFETQIKNLENSNELYDLIHKIIIDNDDVLFNFHNPAMNLAILYGLVVAQNNRAVIHNRIYSEMIGNYMIHKMEMRQLRHRVDYGWGYKNDDGSLDMEAILLGFQSFMKKEYSKKDRDFLERNGRLVFLAFIKPIINGSGYDFKEPQVSEEKRLDVVITHLSSKYIIELKLWRGTKAHEKGLRQLANYLDMQGLQEGYLLIFDHAEIKKWDSAWVDFEGKKILTAWV
jgi:Predicted AAA-ATPase/PD-(D/E)XK nuclease superfamily